MMSSIEVSLSRQLPTDAIIVVEGSPVLFLLRKYAFMSTAVNWLGNRFYRLPRILGKYHTLSQVTSPTVWGKGTPYNSSQELGEVRLPSSSRSVSEIVLSLYWKPEVPEHELLLSVALASWENWKLLSRVAVLFYPWSPPVVTFEAFLSLG